MAVIVGAFSSLECLLEFGAVATCNNTSVFAVAKQSQHYQSSIQAVSLINWIVLLYSHEMNSAYCHFHEYSNRGMYTCATQVYMHTNPYGRCSVFI